MPWHIDGDHPDCGGWAVVKDSDGTVEGCHQTKAEAEQQMAALYAQEGDSKMTRVRDRAAAEERLVHERQHTFPEAARADDGGGEHGDGRTVTGYLTPFNQVVRIMDWLGEYEEQMAPGAFAATLARDGAPEIVRMQFQHGRDPMFGQLPIGTWHRLEEDDYGVDGEGRLLDSWMTAPLRAAILERGLTGMSIRFRAIREEWLSESETESGLERRTILEAQLLEGGPVTWPAYDGTTLSVRALEVCRAMLDGTGAAAPETRSTPPGPENAGADRAQRLVTLAEMRKRALELRGVTAHASTRGGSPAAV